jgi:protein-tyrosine-phosphatase/peptidoglycan/xylan/chitin deacetylase (PgdA/CDA1 family)
MNSLTGSASNTKTGPFMFGIKAAKLKQMMITGSASPFVNELVVPLIGEHATIFMLHRLHAPNAGIFDHTPEFLCAMLERLAKDGYQFVSLERLAARVTGEDATPLHRAVAFTVDDGYADQGDMASEIFLRYDCPVTLFLTTGMVDGSLWLWDAKIRWLVFSTRLSSLQIRFGGELIRFDLSNAFVKRMSVRYIIARCKRVHYLECDALVTQIEEQTGLALPSRAPSAFAPLTWERVRSLESNGVRFAPHSVTHRILSRLEISQAQQEIDLSWARLSEEVNSPLRIFAYPSGIYGSDFGDREIDLAKRSGFNLAVSADGHPWKPHPVGDADYPLRLPRFAISSTLDGVIKNASWIASAQESIPSGFIDCARFLLRNRNRYSTEDVGSSYYLKVADRDVSNLHHGSHLNKIINNVSMFFNKKYGGKKAFLRHCKHQLRYKLGFYDNYSRIHWQNVNRLVFVCAGNICRSPFAEALAKNLGLEACSCGLHLNKRGGLAHPTAERISYNFGVDLSFHQSELLAEMEVEEGDLIVVMEPEQVKHVVAIVPASIRTQITILGIWAEHPRLYIHDPYSQADIYFYECFRCIEESVNNLHKRIRRYRSFIY